MILSTLSLATGPLVAAALLLGVAGVAKLRRPASTGLALAQAGLPGSDALVRALGALEVVAAAAALLVGSWAALPVAALYALFAVFTARQVRQAAATGTAADCGCFGDASAPVGWGHVAVNLLLAAGALGAGLTGAVGLPAALGDAPVATVAVTLLALVATVAIRACLTDLATVRALVRPAEAST